MFLCAVVSNYVGRGVLSKGGMFRALPVFQDFTVEVWEVVNLQEINVVVAVCQK